ncbi:MAG: oligosaccharide flippase family protein [Deltaproteobacteria bacterium]|nr:oligosaccharide flippase family protein [Deltaproteobacteria bacterium]
MIKQLLKDSFVVLVLANLANACRLLLQIIIARYLVTDAFGLYSSVYATVNIFSFIAGAIITFVTQLVLEYSKDGNTKSYILIKSQKYCWIIFVLLLLTAPLFSAILSYYLKIGALLPGLIAFVTNALIFMQSYYAGVLLAEMRFRQNAIKELVIASVHILSVVILVFYVSYSYYGALAALLLAYGVGLIYILNLIKPWTWRAVEVSGKPILWFDAFCIFGRLLTLCLILGAFLGLDVIFARRHLAPTTAGIYSAAALTAKIIFFLTSSLVSIIFPTVCNNMQTGKSSAREMLLLLGIVVLCSSFVTALFVFIPETVMTLLYGQAYTAGAEMLVNCSYFIAVLSVNAVLLNYFAAKKEGHAFYSGVIGVIISVSLIIFSDNKTGISIAQAFLAGSLFLLVSLVLVGVFSKQRIDSCRNYIMLKLP